jgi:hypothetical protein
VPLIPVPTKASFNFSFPNPKLKEVKGKDIPAESNDIDFKNDLLDFSILLFFI